MNDLFSGGRDWLKHVKTTYQDHLYCNLSKIDLAMLLLDVVARHYPPRLFHSYVYNI